MNDMTRMTAGVAEGAMDSNGKRNDDGDRDAVQARQIAQFGGAGLPGGEGDRETAEALSFRVPGNSAEGREPPPQKLQRFLELAVTGIITMAATLALVTALSPSHHTGAKPIVVLDADRAAATFVRSPGISDLDEAAFGDAVTRFHGALLKEMLRYGAKTGTVVLSSSAVLAGEVPDVTDLLTQNAMRSVK